jgi:hypothetical protein
LPHFVVHQFQCRKIKQASGYTGLIGNHHYLEAMPIEFGYGLKATGQGLPFFR